MTEARGRSAMDGAHRGRQSRSTLRGRLRRAFAGLTWRWFGVYCLVLVPFALSRPNVHNAVLAGAQAWPVAQAVLTAYVLSLLWFTPVLLAVVAVANLAQGRPAAKLAWVATALVAACLAGAALSALGMSLVFERSRIVAALTQGSAVENAVRFLGFALGDLALCAVATAFVYFLRRSAASAAEILREEQQREALAQENAEAQLSLMQAQIEPHFLFNSLAIIRRLYETDPARGRAMLRHLSRYLEASLPALREARSTLGRELALAVAYLNVQKIRMGARLEVDVDVPPALHALPVPPMMLSTLAENAVIHGVGPMPAGGRVTISARRAGGQLVVAVADDGRGFQSTWGTGVGLANIRARLATEFGGAAALDLTPHGDRGVTASITLPVGAPVAVP